MSRRAAIVALVASLVALAPLTAQGPDPSAVPLSDAALAELFPRPPATVAARLDADFDGDGRQEVLAVYDTSLDGTWRLALVTLEDGEPRLDGVNVKRVDVPWPGRLAPLDLTGDATPEAVLVGRADDHERGFAALDLRDGRLQTLLSLSAAVDPSVLDIDGDGRLEVVELRREPVGYADGVADWRLIAHHFDGVRYLPTGWRSPRSAEAQAATQAARDAAAAHLWPRALEAARLAEGLEPGPATAQNRWLLAATAERYVQQAVALAGELGPQAPAQKLRAAVAAVLAGDFAAAGERLWTLPGPSALPAGWQAAFGALTPQVEAAFALAPDLADDAGAQFVRGLTRLAGGQRREARSALHRALALRGGDPALRAWAAFLQPPARLYYLGRDGRVQFVDVAATGEVGRVATEPALGKVRSLTGSPARAAFAYVPAAGDRVVYRQADGDERMLLAGEYLYLAPNAVSPDGRFLAVDSGTSLIRQIFVVETQNALLRGAITYAGHFLWAPDSRSLAVEVPVAVEPPLPWEDGGSRDVRMVGVDGKPLATLTRGDANTVWSLEDWLVSGRLFVARETYRRNADGDTLLTGLQRFVVDPGSERPLPTGGVSRHEQETAFLRQRLAVPEERLDVLSELFHPRYLVYRLSTGAGAELWLYPRDGSGRAVRVGAAPPLEQSLVASWGMAPEPAAPGGGR